jgi:addiction module RelE/StbE family toxin
MRVHWTNAARCHLQAIHDFIARDSKSYASRMVDRLTRRSQQLADHPLIGAKAEEYEGKEIREIFVKPYRLFYRVKPDQIDILAVIHAARELPTDVE